MMWLLIKASDDGEPITVLDSDGLRELLTDPEGNYGVREFLDHWPLDGTVHRDPMYWGDGVALLVSAEWVAPKVETVTRWVIKS